LIQTKEIRLRHNQNTFSFEFSNTDFISEQQDIRSLYMLQNYDNAWRKAGEEKTAYYFNLPPGKYVFKVKAINAAGIATEKNITVIIAPPWWQTWWAYSAYALCFAASVVLLSKAQQRRLIKKERERNKLLELEMQALRAQMNPHFIFNCLSSINSFILKNKTEEASKYLTKFSRLIRMVLNNSKEAFISLEDELETLRLYLDMEKLRFKNSFDYGFNFKNAVEVENILIPPLLLQPFAENAIWHGLMHLPDRQAGKQETGFLNFDFSAEEKFLTCIITDNGVGREQAELLKSKSAEKQKSMGLKITTERLSLLNDSSNQQTFFTIEDLTDENENAIGTRVHLKIYYKEMMEV
jgi:LytS/YehU family sensor histidine kinase